MIRRPPRSTLFPYTSSSDLLQACHNSFSFLPCRASGSYFLTAIHPLLSVVLVKDISTLRTESRRILRIFRFPSALITTVKRRSCRLLCSTVRTEFAFVYCATGTRPAFVLCRSLRIAFRTEVACHRSSARAFPCARFWFRLDRKSTRLNSSHASKSRMPSSA